MKTLGSVLKMIFLFLLLVLAIIAFVGLLGFAYVKLINLVGNQLLRLLISVIWFGGVAGALLHFGKMGIRRIFEKE